MKMVDEFSQYLDLLKQGLGNNARSNPSRHRNFIDYCKGLMLPLERKSVEPMAAVMDHENVRSRHQGMHHFVADSPWSDRAILDKAWEWVDERMPAEQEVVWIIDETGNPKKGKHSVGVAHQYCGQVGKKANCQVAVSLSVACEQASLLIDHRLYLPRSWTDDPERCKAAGVPEGVGFATKPQIALEQIRAACERGVRTGVVLADSVYGNDSVFRAGLDALDLRYMVHVNPTHLVSLPGVKLLPPKPYSGRGRRSTGLRYAKGHEPQSCKHRALNLDESQWQYLTWREGTNEPLSGWFAAIRVHVAHEELLRDQLRDEQWLLVEWPEDEPEPTKYWFSTLPESSSLQELVSAAKKRWYIERDYQELKDEIGLNHYEGRNWRGFHHHATLCIASYAFLVGQRLTHPESNKKKFGISKEPSIPEDFIPRGSPTSTTSC